MIFQTAAFINFVYRPSFVWPSLGRPAQTLDIETGPEGADGTFVISLLEQNHRHLIAVILF